MKKKRVFIREMLPEDFILFQLKKYKEEQVIFRPAKKEKSEINLHYDRVVPIKQKRNRISEETRLSFQGSIYNIRISTTRGFDIVYVEIIRPKVRLKDFHIAKRLGGKLEPIRFSARLDFVYEFNKGGNSLDRYVNKELPEELRFKEIVRKIRKYLCTGMYDYMFQLPMMSVNNFIANHPLIINTYEFLNGIGYIKHLHRLQYPSDESVEKFAKLILSSIRKCRHSLTIRINGTSIRVIKYPTPRFHPRESVKTKIYLRPSMFGIGFDAVEINDINELPEKIKEDPGFRALCAFYEQFNLFKIFEHRILTLSLKS